MTSRAGLVGLATTFAYGATLCGWPLTTAAADDPAIVAAPSVIVEPAPRRPSYAFRFAGDDPLPYHGMASFEDAGLGAQPMLYGPGLIGAAVGLVAHGLIVQSIRKSQKTRLQEAADEVLVPYADVIAHFTSRDLIATGLPKMATVADAQSLSADAPAAGGRFDAVVEFTPVFGVAADSRALVLDNLITVGDGSGTAPVGRFMVRVVSAPQLAADPVAAWTADEGRRFRDESGRLLALSFDIALTEANARRTAAATPVPPADLGPRTVRYAFGATERTERATVVGRDCDRIVLRTLRGGLLSAPTAGPRSDEVDGRRCETSSLEAAR